LPDRLAAPFDEDRVPGELTRERHDPHEVAARAEPFGQARIDEAAHVALQRPEPAIARGDAVESRGSHELELGVHEIDERRSAPPDAVGDGDSGIIEYRPFHVPLPNRTPRCPRGSA